MPEIEEGSIVGSIVGSRVTAFKVGMRVMCVRPLGGLVYGETYTVQTVFGDDGNAHLVERTAVGDYTMYMRARFTYA